MDRLEVNDLIANWYVGSLKSQGYAQIAENIKRNYEGQRAEIVANEGGKPNE